MADQNLFDKIEKAALWAGVGGAITSTTSLIIGLPIALASVYDIIPLKTASSLLDASIIAFYAGWIGMGFGGGFYFMRVCDSFRQKKQVA